MSDETMRSVTVTRFEARLLEEPPKTVDGVLQMPWSAVVDEEGDEVTADDYQDCLMEAMVATAKIDQDRLLIAQIDTTYIMPVNPTEDEFKDTPELAIRDRRITALDYCPGRFRKFFTTPYHQYSEYAGKPFSVIKQIRRLKLAKGEEVGEDDMYLIRFEDGNEIEAFGHEVCVLNYANCLPKFESPTDPVVSSREA